MTDSLPGRAKILRNHLIWLTIRVLVAIFAGLPFALSSLLGRATGVVCYVVLASVRRRVRARLKAGLGVSTGLEKRVFGAFVTMGALLADTLALLRKSEQAGSRLSLDKASETVFRQALNEGRGVVLVAAHLGPWERMASVLTESGIPLTAVAREGFDPRMTRLYERIRAPRGVRSLFRNRPELPLTIVRELALGRTVGMLVDLPARVPCTRMQLFGEMIDMPVGAARIALARRAALLVGTCVPGQKKASLFNSPPATVHIERIDFRDLQRTPGHESELQSRIARALDARVKQWPEAWLGLFASPRLRQTNDSR